MLELINLLKQYLANTVVYKSVAHGYHWNVEGPLFTQYHAFFEKIYDFSKLKFVLKTGLKNDKFDEIENLDFVELRKLVNEIYSK